MATKAQLEAELEIMKLRLEANQTAAATKELFKKVNIEQAQRTLGIKLVGLGGTKDKKIQAIQDDVRTLTILLASISEGKLPGRVIEVAKEA